MLRKKLNNHPKNPSLRKEEVHYASGRHRGPKMNWRNPPTVRHGRVMQMIAAYLEKHAKNSKYLTDLTGLRQAWPNSERPWAKA